MVDRVERGWKDLDLEISEGYGEEELGYALHTWILWNKQYIRFPRGTTEYASSGRSLGEETDPSVHLPSPTTARDPSVDPPSPATTRDPSVDPPSPAGARDPSP